jgi:polysaccharide pyruvyl transferase WcaK-like protein
VPPYRPNVVPIDTVGRRAWLNGNTRNADALAFVDAVAHARLVAVAGMGGITDAFKVCALGVLATLDLAIRHDVPTAMMGQGMGPLTDPDLRQRAAGILAKVDRIALREARAGMPLLRQLGVPAERVCTTGDDAIELALGVRGRAPGSGLGVNLRAAAYSGVDDGIIESVRLGVQRAADRVGAPLVAIPISRVPGEEDAAPIRRLMRDAETLPEIGLSPAEPREVIARVQRCRVVVAGSYHAGVFALACGVPVVGLVRSPYYVDKFLGLADQFACGCEVVTLDGSDVPDRIDTAVQRLWAAAEHLRPALRAAAERQAADSRGAYEHLRSLIGRRRRGRAAYKYGRSMAARVVHPRVGERSPR